MSTKTLTHVLFQQEHLINHSTCHKKTLTSDEITETAFYYTVYVSGLTVYGS